MKIHHRITIWVILASATLTVMAGAIVAPVQVPISDELNLDETSTGLILTTHALSLAIVSPIIGKFIDRIGTKKPLIFGLIIYGLAGGSGLFLSSYWALIVSRAFLGIGVAAIVTPITIMILNMFTGEKRNKVMGWRGSANSFGGIFWPLLGGFLGGISWHAPFGVYMVGIPLGLLVIFTVPETQQRLQQVKGETIIRVIRENRLLLAIYGFMFFIMVLLYTLVVFLPFKLESVGINATSSVGLFLSVMGLSAGIMSLIYFKIRSILSYRSIFITALALYSLGFLMLSQTSSLLLLAASIAFFGLGQGMVMPAVNLWVGEVVKPHILGRVISYIATFGLLGQFFSPILWRPINHEFGFDGVFFSAGLICVLLLISTLSIALITKKSTGTS